MFGLVGKKLGMTRIFNENGVSIPVTVIRINENRITQIKNISTHGYNSVQVTTGDIKENKKNKSEIGHFKKNNIKAGLGLWEFRVKDINKYNIGDSFGVNILSKLNKVDITGISKGKGFAGTIKRWNFSGQDATHGNSLSHRVPGSIGQNQTPGKVFKGKKMAGHLGNERKTIHNIQIIKIDIDKNIVLVKGSVPGTIQSKVMIKPAIKIHNRGS